VPRFHGDDLLLSPLAVRPGLTARRRCCRLAELFQSPPTDLYWQRSLVSPVRFVAVDETVSSVAPGPPRLFFCLLGGGPPCYRMPCSISGVDHDVLFAERFKVSVAAYSIPEVRVTTHEGLVLASSRVSSVLPFES